MFSTTHGHTQCSIQKTDGLKNASLLTQVHDFIPQGEMNLDCIHMDKSKMIIQRHKHA